MQLVDLARDAGVDATVALANGGTVEFQTAGSVAAATVPLNATAFGASSTGTANMNTSPVPEDGNATGNANPVTKAVWKNNGGTTIWQNSVSGQSGAGEIKFSDDDDVITPSSVVQLTSFSYTQPAGSI